MLSDKQLLESELLVVRCQRGDRSALEDIAKLWEQPLFYYLRRLTASEADAWELLQDTWLKVIRKDCGPRRSFRYHHVQSQPPRTPRCCGRCRARRSVRVGLVDFHCCSSLRRGTAIPANVMPALGAPATPIDIRPMNSSVF